jgi:hypothetical protein
MADSCAHGNILSTCINGRFFISMWVTVSILRRILLLVVNYSTFKDTKCELHNSL